MPAKMPTGGGARSKGGPSAMLYADDPAFKADVLLLLRMVLADGAAGARELGVLSRIAAGSLGIEDGFVPEVVDHVRGFGSEVGMAQAVATFRAFDRERRVLLARELAAIAAGDEELARREGRFRARLLELLDLRPDDIVDPATA